MKSLRPLVAALATFAALGGTAHAQAADWPAKPITMIVPYAPGGFADTRVRLLARKLGESLGQPIVVENKAGAGGVVGTNLIAKAAPDGYTIGTGNLAPMAVNPSLMKDMPYNPQKDLAPVILIENSPLVLSVNNELPVKTLADLIAMAKKQPGKLSFGSSGVGGAHHLSGEMFREQAKIDIVHVPYKGSGPAVADAVGGQIEIIFDNLPSSMPQIQAGKLNAMAIAWPDNIASLKGVPNFKEAGFPVLNQPVWYGLLAPKGTPMDVVNKLRDAAVVALKDPKVIKALDDQGSAPSGNTPEEFAKEIKEQYDWAKDVVKKQNIKLD